MPGAVSVVAELSATGSIAPLTTVMPWAASSKTEQINELETPPPPIRFARALTT